MDKREKPREKNSTELTPGGNSLSQVKEGESKKRGGKTLIIQSRKGTVYYWEGVTCRLTPSMKQGIGRIVKTGS